MAAEGPLLHRRRLGVELRRLRGHRTLEDVAGATLISTSKLSRLENGQGVPQPRDIRDLINFYEVDAATADRLRRWANAGRRQAWWKQFSDVVSQPLDAFLDFESGASTIRAYASTVLPGLLQTEQYAAHLLRGIPPAKTEAEVQRLVEIRQRRRQDVLEDGESPARLITLVDEAVLRRRIGTEDDRRQQLEHLHRQSRRKNVSLQIVPFSAGVHAGLMGMFTIFQFADDIDRDIVSVESHAGDQYLEEQASVLDYLRMFDAISGKALDHDESRDLLSSLISTPSEPKDSDDLH